MRIQKRFKIRKENSAKQGWYSWNHIQDLHRFCLFHLLWTELQRISKFSSLPLLLLPSERTQKKGLIKWRIGLQISFRPNATHNEPYDYRPNQISRTFMRPLFPLNVGPSKILGPSARTRSLLHHSGPTKFGNRGGPCSLGKKKMREIEFAVCIWSLPLQRKPSILPFSPIAPV